MAVRPTPAGGDAVPASVEPRVPHVPGGGWQATFASLGERDYLSFFTGNIAFFMGMQMQFLLRGYLAYEITNSAAALGVISAAVSVPMLVSAPFGGVVADRVNKRTLLIVTQSVAAVASVIVAVLIIAGEIRFWHLIAVSLLTSVVFSFNMPARQALVPQLVPKQLLMNAISLQMGSMNLTRILAPALAGVLIGPIGVGYVYLITFGLFVLATASEFRLPTLGMKAAPTGASFLADFVGGFSYIRRHSLIALLIFSGVLMPLFSFPVQQVLVVFAEDVFHRGASGLGLLASLSGVGGLVGAIVSANMDRNPNKGHLMLAGGLTMGTLLIAFALAPSFWFALFFLAAANVGQMLFQATNNTVIMGSLPEEVRGRVMSVTQMSFGLMPLGVIPITLATDAYGARGTIAVSSLVMLIALCALFAGVPRLRRLRLEAPAAVELSPTQAAALVAAGTITTEEADRMTGRILLD